MCDSTYAKRPEEAHPQGQEVASGCQGLGWGGVAADENRVSFNCEENAPKFVVVMVAQL